MSGSASALTDYVTGTGAVTGPNLNAMEQTCDSFSQLRSFTGVPGVQVYCRGQTVPGDGYQGVFWWNAVGSTADDNANYIVPSGASSGEWVRIGSVSFAYTATVASSTSSITFAHGLAATPTAVLATPQSDVGSDIRWWVTANATNIMITTSSSVSGGVTFYVTAQLGNPV